MAQGPEAEQVEHQHSSWKNTLRDVDHLSTHWMCKRDYFVTCDKGILKKRKALAVLGIRVVEPGTIVAASRKGATEFPENLEAAWRASFN